MNGQLISDLMKAAAEDCWPRLARKLSLAPPDIDVQMTAVSMFIDMMLVSMMAGALGHDGDRRSEPQPLSRQEGERYIVAILHATLSPYRERAKELEGFSIERIDDDARFIIEISNRVMEACQGRMIAIPLAVGTQLMAEVVARDTKNADKYIRQAMEALAKIVKARQSA